MRAHILSLTLLLAVAGAAVAQEPASIAPTAALHMMIDEMLAKPQQPQLESTTKFFPLARRDMTEPQEVFALAEGYFLTFVPDSAYPLFEQFKDDGGELGRLAWQRMLQMQFRAYDSYEHTETMLAEFYRRYPPARHDGAYGATAVGNIAGRYASLGQHERAVDFIVGEVERLPTNAGYSGFLLPGRFYASFAATGRTQLAKDLTQRALDGLRAYVAERGGLRNAARPGNRGVGLPHQPGKLHMFSLGLLEDDPAFDREALLDGQVFGMIAQLEAALQRMTAADAANSGGDAR